VEWKILAGTTVDFTMQNMQFWTLQMFNQLSAIGLFRILFYITKLVLWFCTFFFV